MLIPLCSSEQIISLLDLQVNWSILLLPSECCEVHPGNVSSPVFTFMFWNSFYFILCNAVLKFY